MAILSRSDWNDLIDQINALAEECNVDGYVPVEHVEPNHIWAKSDIRRVQEALEQICNEAEFTEPIPDLWEQAIISEIEAAIANGCCDTEGCWEVSVILHITGPGGDGSRSGLFYIDDPTQDLDEETVKAQGEALATAAYAQAQAEGFMACDGGTFFEPATNTIVSKESFAAWPVTCGSNCLGTVG